MAAPRAASRAGASPALEAAQAACLHIVGQQNRLRHFSHGLALVHARLSNLTEGFLLGKALLLHQKALGTLNDLACFQLFDEVPCLFFESTKHTVACQSHLNCWNDLALP